MFYSLKQKDVGAPGDRAPLYEQIRSRCCPTESSSPVLYYLDMESPSTLPFLDSAQQEDERVRL